MFKAVCTDYPATWKSLDHQISTFFNSPVPDIGSVLSILLAMKSVVYNM